LSKEEKLALFERVKKIAGNRAKVIAGTTNYCTKESVELTKEAEKIGVASAISQFCAPEHRIEFVRSVGGVSFYDDSKLQP